MLTQERLKELLNYDPVTGDFTWIKSVSHKIKIGNKAGCVTNLSGWKYILIGIDNENYLAHRLAWLWVTGAWPQKLIDHENNNGLDNSWKNLREATETDNMCNTTLRSNNTSGVKGVSWHKGMKKWEASVQYKKKRIYCGYFNTIEEAELEVKKLREKLHKKFTCHQ